ncbi:hypothetical protein [Nocardia bovistercoris]|nr:hypothetical protein [Nocardia bovistercoris]
MTRPPVAPMSTTADNRDPASYDEIDPIDRDGVAVPDTTRTHR